MDDLLLFNLSYGTPHPTVCLQAVTGLADLAPFLKDGWTVRVFRELQTLEAFDPADLPPDVAMSPAGDTQSIDVLQTLAVSVTATRLMEVRHSRPRVVRVLGTSDRGKAEVYRQGLERAAMLLGGLGYSVYRVDNGGLRLVRGGRGKTSGDAEGPVPFNQPLLAFADEALTADAKRLAAVAVAARMRAEEKSRPQDLARARAYIGMLEDAMLALQGRRSS